MLVEEVVIEGPSRKDPTLLTGRTRQNKLVHVPSASPIRAGSYAKVRITSAAPHFLRGELVEHDEQDVRTLGRGHGGSWRRKAGDAAS